MNHCPLPARWLLTVLAACGLPGVAAALPQYALARVVPLPGEGGWDYLTVDAQDGRLFIAHGTRVEVIDTLHMRRVGQIADTPGVHGIAIARDLNRGFVSAGGSDAVVVFDLASLARLAEIKVTGANPDAILYEPATQRVFTFNGRGRNATVIDARAGTVLGTVALDAKPEFAAADGAGTVYVNLEDRNSLAAIDARAMKVTAVWPLPGCESPSGLAINRGAGELFSVCQNQVMVVTDAHDGAQRGRAPIGGGADAAAYDPGARLAFASCGAGLVSAVAVGVHGDAQAVQSIATQRGARTMALDERTHRIYLVTADFGPAPPATAEHPHPRPAIVPDTFRLLVLNPHHEKFTTTAEGRSP